MVRHVSDRVALMYLGKMVEMAPSRTSNAPAPSLRQRPALGGAGPGPRQGGSAGADHPGRRRAVADQPAIGCRFHPRCPKAAPAASRKSRSGAPARRRGGPPAACHFPVEDGEDLSKARPTIAAEDRIVEPGGRQRLSLHRRK